nr:hypothetical protein [uncultured Halomonas sp.]
MDKLRAELQRRAASIPAPKLLQRMGYPKPREAAIQRLQEVLGDPDLGLTSGGFDFRYGSRAFLCALCEALGLAEDDYLPAIDARQQWLKEERDAFKPWISVEVVDKTARVGGFFRAMAVGKRYLTLPKDAWQMTRKEQLRLAKKLVREHMAKTGGELPILGKIEGYRFYFDMDRWIFLGRNGGVKKDGSDVVSMGANRQAESE